MSFAGPASEPPSVAAARLLQIIEAKFGDGLKAARAPGAIAPRPDAETLRLAYLDVLKLCLTDLGGTRTTSVARTFEGDVMSRELEGDLLRFRTAGMDWPLHGLTMVGLARLDDLQRCVESISRDGVPGDLIEAGTWRGGASILARATLDSLGEDERTLWVADSFQGFPQAEHETDSYDLNADLANVDFLAIPLEEVKENFARFGLEHGVHFVPGFFEDTLPGLAGRRWSVVRLDGDTYDATKLSLEVLYPGLNAGGYLIIDDYLQIDQCREAVDDFRREHGIDEPLVEVDWSCVRWQRVSAQQNGTHPPHAPSTPVANRPAPPQPVPRQPHARVPAIEEVELRHQLTELQNRLAQAEAEVGRLSGSPIAGPRRGLGRRLGRSSG
jgi:O-methyltransferase